MSSLTEIFDRLRIWWNDLQMSARIGALVAGVAGILALVGVGVWSSRPQYTTLANQLAPSEAAEIVSKLDADGIDHKLNFSASAIMVPKNQLSDARMLVGDRAVDGASESEWNDSVLGDPGMNQYKMLRRREQIIARSIRRMTGISDATVHIAQSERTPFIQDQRPATASVVIELQPGAYVSRETAAAIVALVSGSVEGLEPDGVSILDTQGRMLSSAGSAIDADVSAQFGYRRRLEAELQTKADTMLVGMLGERRAIVRISADIDFTRSEREETTFDPDAKVPKKEEIESVSRTTSSGLAQGPAGIRPLNVRGPSSTIAPAPQNETTENSTTDYEIGSRIDKVTEAPGNIRRLTIAVMADVRGGSEQAAEDDAAATPTVTREQIESIVKQATGFDESRGDQIEILITELAGFESEDVEFIKTQKWEFYNQIIRSSSLGLASIVALMLGLLTVYRLRPITLPAAEQAGRRDFAISDFSDRVKENPDVVKAVVSAWLNESNDAESDSARRAA